MICSTVQKWFSAGVRQRQLWSRAGCSKIELDSEPCPRVPTIVGMCVLSPGPGKDSGQWEKLTSDFLITHVSFKNDIQFLAGTKRKRIYIYDRNAIFSGRRPILLMKLIESPCWDRAKIDILHGITHLKNGVYRISSVLPLSLFLMVLLLLCMEGTVLQID